ncbi:hypothetical protein FKM82_024490, partial [Ascaphus truei]
MISSLRWTRREQADFYRTVSSFGVIYEPEKKCFDWTQFRAMSRLDKKADESLEKYFHSFVAMCRNVCRLPLRKDDGSADPSIFLDPITEERAARTLYRIELLRKVREQVLRHPHLQERLKLCRPSLYLPVWWECGKHDRDLLLGTAKHGLSRTDYYIMNDPQLTFLDAYRNYAQHKRNGGENMCCHYQMNAKMYEPAACNLERMCESIKDEAEIKIEALEEPIPSPACSPPDLTCETFISQVGDMIPNSHDECSLPDSLMCMMYDEKTCNSEHSSLTQESFMGLEAKSEAAEYSLGKTPEEKATPLKEAAVGDCFLGSIEPECEPMEGQDTMDKPFYASKSHHLGLLTEDSEQPHSDITEPRDMDALNDDHFCTSLGHTSEQSLALDLEFLDKTFEDQAVLSPNINEDQEGPESPNCGDLPMQEKEGWGAELREMKGGPIVKWDDELPDMKQPPLEGRSGEQEAEDLSALEVVSKHGRDHSAQLLDGKESGEMRHKSGLMLSGLLKCDAVDLKDEAAGGSLGVGSKCPFEGSEVVTCEVKKERAEVECSCK